MAYFTQFPGVSVYYYIMDDEVYLWWFNSNYTKKVFNSQENLSFWILNLCSRVEFIEIFTL